MSRSNITGEKTGFEPNTVQVIAKYVSESVTFLIAQRGKVSYFFLFASVISGDIATIKSVIPYVLLFS